MPASVTGQGDGVSWSRIFDSWVFVESGIHAMFGVDISRVKVRRTRSWRWFKARLAGLLASDTALARTLAPQEPGPQEPVETEFS